MNKPLSMDATYGLLLVLGWAPAPTRRGGEYVFARCACGRVVWTSARAIREGRRKSCGCVPVEQLRARRPAQPGDVFGRLTVLEEGPLAGYGIRTVFCSCSCGKARHRVRVGPLIERRQKSCGCLAREQLARLNERRQRRGAA